MITIKLPNSRPAPEPLPFGGTSPVLGEVAVNSLYFEKNGTPWLPVMGEFHFSRYPAAQWEQELLKMKAGGIDIVATYIFWIHHEEEQGVWDFTGDRCLRNFIALCKKHSFPLILRIGPWAHGECRNGGFPDWVAQDKSMMARTNDPKYLSLVRPLYRHIYEQAQGYFWEEGGPIVGVQFENEYGHCGGPNDEQGKNHMRKLKEIALSLGFKTPIYTATAWGGAVVVDMETLPVVGGYVDAPWDQSLGELPENPNFLMQTALNDPLIGSDHKRDDNGSMFTCKINDYPFLTAELGGGMQPTEHRRVVAFPKDTEALSLCKLGSGANLLGYYMYHGGTNPQGKLSTLQESKETGYPNDLPVKSYDFEAPLGETGQAAESYGRLKRIHLLLQEWGALIAPSVTVIPPESSRDAADPTAPRFSVRHNTEEHCGFVFMSNHMRKRVMSEQCLSLRLTGDGLALTLPPLTLKDGEMRIIPYNLPLGDAVLESTNATPLTRIGSRWFFYCDEAPVYRFRSSTASIVTLRPEDAAMAYRFGEALYLAPCPLYEKEGHVYAEIHEETTVTVYGPEGAPKTLTLTPPSARAACTMEQTGEGLYDLTLTYEGKVEECLLALDYIGDKAQVYLEGALIADWFTTGLPFRVPLKRHGFPQKLRVAIAPSVKERYFDLAVPAGCSLHSAACTVLSTCML